MPSHPASAPAFLARAPPDRPRQLSSSSNIAALSAQSTDSEESIAARLDVFEKRFFDAVPEIEPKDPQRGFSHEQRLAIFRRDNGICQLKLRCDGVKVGWDHWHADHKTAHSKGGKSIVANGQVACPDCNFSKGASRPASASP